VTDTINPDVIDSKTWNVLARVEKYESDEALARGDAPYEVVEAKDNLLLNNGIARLLDLLIGAGGQAYTNANSRIGVGNSNTAAAASQTDLAGASKYFMTMDATFPSRSAQTVTWKATFASGVAQFAWEEWGIDVGTTAGTTVVVPLLNRKVQSFGTKGATAWVFTVTITIA
jgi:hypothetical protein